MIGKLLTLGVLAIGLPLNVSYNNVDVDFKTNYVEDLLERERDDKVAFSINVSNISQFSSLSNGDHLYYTQFFYINNLNQVIESTWVNIASFSSFGGSTNSMLSNMLSHRPTPEFNTYSYSSFGYYIDLSYSSSTGITAYLHYVFSSYGSWRWQGSINIPMWYNFAINGDGYTFSFYDNAVGITTSNQYDETRIHGNFAQSASGWYLYTQRCNIIGDNTHTSLNDLNFTFYCVLASENDNYTQGYNDGYIIGSKDGNATGFEDGYQAGKEDGLETGYQNGYANGLNDALILNDYGDLSKLFGVLADTPILFIKSIFNFELFGMNVFVAIMSLLTGLLVLYIVKKII